MDSRVNAEGGCSPEGFRNVGARIPPRLFAPSAVDPTLIMHDCHGMTAAGAEQRGGEPVDS